MSATDDSMVAPAEASDERALRARAHVRREGRRPANRPPAGWRAAVPGAVLVFLLLIAFAIRLDGIGAPPFDNGVSRQFHAALIARMYYLDGSTSLTPDEQSVVAALRWTRMPS